MRTRWLLLLLTCLGLVAACGGDAGGDATPVADPADATTCAELADIHAASTANLLELIGDRSDADMETPPAELETAADEWMATLTAVYSRVGDLCSGDAEFEALVCDALGTTEPAGEAAERFLRDNVAFCD